MKINKLVCGLGALIGGVTGLLVYNLTNKPLELISDEDDVVDTQDGVEVENEETEEE